MRLNRTRSRLLLLALSLSPPAGAGRLSAGEAPSAGPAAMLADVETAAIRRRASRPFGHVEMAGVTYFTAHDRSHGWELWRSDGTDIGTSVLADILPGPIGSFPRELTVMGGRLYFTAFDGIHGFGLWSSDGTPAGTRLVKGAEGDFLRPGQLTAYGATLLFTAGPRNKPALWRSDGTTPGTQKVLDLTPSDDRAAFAYPRSPGVLSLGQVWFMSRSGYRRVLWRTDGTTGGTTRVWTDTPTAPWHGGNFDIFAAYPGGVLFRGQHLEGDAVWRSDGTPAGTFPLASAAPSTLLGADWFATLGPWTYFLATTGSDSYYGYRELWRTDGSVAGTTRRADFGPGAGATQLTASAGRLFVVFLDQGVRSIDAAEQNWHTVFTGESPQIAAAPGGIVIAAANALARSNGLPGGTQVLSSDALAGRVDPVYSSAHARSWPLTGHAALACLSSACWFRGRYNTQPMPWGLRVEAPWRSDLTPAGTRPVLPEDGHTRGSWPEQFVAYGGDVYFTTNGAPERHPWRRADLRLLKATAGGVSVVENQPNQPCDDWDAPDGCRLNFLTALPNALVYFDPAEFSWWGTQGDPGGRWRAENHDFEYFARRGTGVINGRLLAVDFGKNHPTMELIAIDGGKDGRVTLGAPPEAVGSLFDQTDMHFTPVGNWMYFASDSALWKTDGTPGSVQLVKAVAAAELTDVGGTLYFSSDGALWKSDGTEAGTVEVAPTQGATRLLALGSRLFFAAADAARGEELWTSDGTPGGTLALADISPGPRSSGPDGLAAVGARLFFSADDGVRGRELWRWDPVTGVSLVADIAPGPQGSLGDGPLIVAGGNHAWFPAWTATHGVELWSSDGTPAGTSLVQDIVYGPPGSHPRELTAIGSRLYFSADDGVHGQEPWSLPLP